MPTVDVLVQLIDGSHVPVIMQRRCTVEVPQVQLPDILFRPKPIRTISGVFGIN